MTHMPEDPSADITLMALVARKYYMGGYGKTEIGEQLSLSRFKVARLLDEARDHGIVSITINEPGDVNLNLSRELRQALGLRRAIVIDDPLDRNQLLPRLGEAATALLAALIEEDDVVGIASTRTMIGVEQTAATFRKSTFVQLTGALRRDDAADVIGCIRNLTAWSGGKAHVFYAPMVAPDEESRDNYLRQPDVREAFDHFPRLDVFVTGVGSWTTGLSLIHDYLPEDIRAEATALGVVCEAAGVPIDATGHTVDCRARRRIVAGDIEDIRGARVRMGVVFDPAKARSVRVTIDCGLLNTIVTHRSLAEALLAL
jgi:DNA-binding transcriptional regulator LsrR (DeoR family)